MPVPTLLTLFVFTILLNSVSSMDLRNLRRFDDWSRREADDLLILSKRHISGSDPWSLCPHTMERVDCFYQYLRVYARLRKAAEYVNSVSVRNIGKRSISSSIKDHQDVI